MALPSNVLDKKLLFVWTLKQDRDRSEPASEVVAGGNVPGVLDSVADVSHAEYKRC